MVYAHVFNRGTSVRTLYLVAPETDAVIIQTTPSLQIRPKLNVEAGLRGRSERRLQLRCVHATLSYSTQKLIAQVASRC